MRYSKARRITDITLAAVEHWMLRGTAERKWSPVTRRLKLRYISLFVKWLRFRGALNGNPLAKLIYPKIPQNLPRHLPLEKAEELLLYARNMRFRTPFESTRAHSIIATFMFTGLRKSELRKLEVSNVNLESRAVSIRQGKGGKGRILPIPPQLEDILKVYHESRDQSRYAGSPYFFIGLAGASMLSDKVIQRIINRLRAESQIYFTPHMLRHTFATLLLEGGCDLFSLSKLMGHSDIKTTSIYLSTTIDHLRGQVMKHPLISVY